jgi:hypothetical protein
LEQLWVQQKRWNGATGGHAVVADVSRLFLNVLQVY